MRGRRLVFGRTNLSFTLQNVLLPTLSVLFKGNGQVLIDLAGLLLRSRKCEKIICHGYLIILISSSKVPLFWSISYKMESKWTFGCNLQINFTEWGPGDKIDRKGVYGFLLFCNQASC